MQPQDFTSEISSEARADLYKGVSVLGTCEKLKAKYPKEYAKINEIFDQTTIIFSLEDDENLCAFASSCNNAIILYPGVWKYHTQLCYDARQDKVLAHEFLHLIGLPPHKAYNTYKEFELADPIMDMIYNCFDKRNL